MPTPSIRQRVTRSLLGISLVGCLLVTAVVWGVIRHELDELMDQGLRETGETLYSVLAPHWRTARDAPAPAQHTPYEEHLVWQVVHAPSARVVHHSHQSPKDPLLAAVSPQLQHTPDGRWRVWSVALSPDPEHFLLVAQSEDEREEARMETVLLTLLGALVVGGLAMWQLNRRFGRELQPLVDLSDAVRHHDPLRPETALPPAQRAELAPMVEAIVGLGQRLAQRVLAERAFAAHAAHALRTPLAGIDAQLAVAVREAAPPLQQRLSRTREATNRLGHVVRGLLALFRSGNGPKPGPVTLDTLLAHWPADRLHLDADRQLTLNTDPDLMAAVVLNLLDNAAQHGATHVVITGHATPDGAFELRLHDNGHGCPPNQLQHLRRALDKHDHHPATGLKGLGLILADVVMQAQRGMVTLPDVASGFCVALQVGTTAHRT